jgi:hypothetical protein
MEIVKVARLQERSPQEQLAHDSRVPLTEITKPLQVIRLTRDPRTGQRRFRIEDPKGGREGLTLHDVERRQFEGVGGITAWHSNGSPYFRDPFPRNRNC